MQENNIEDNQIKRAEVDQSHIFSGLGKGQKIALAVLVFFAVIVFVFGIINIQKGIYSPFERKTSIKNSAVSPENLCPSGNCSDLSEAELKNKDTDNDGLSDYDELNFYKTSPYLEDSDSDGFLDKEEIDNNKNPNCPTGRDCNDVLFNEDAQSANSGQANNIDLEELNAQIKPSNMQIGDLGNEDMDVADLRKLLIEAGMKKELLNQISDKDLMESFSEVVAEQAK